MVMRIAFFGGSFDPPHRGHLAIATAALERLHLDRILFAPVGRQPLKRDAVPSSYADRCAMVELATAPNPKMELSLLDAPTPSGQPNYTFDTLERLKSTLAPEDQLFSLIGADSFLTLRQWHRAAELLLLSDFIVAARPGFSLEDLAAAVPTGLAPLPQPEQGPGYQAISIRNDSSDDESEGHPSTLYLLPNLNVDISATQIRSALAAGTAGEDVLSPAVVDYIESHGLYRSG